MGLSSELYALGGPLHQIMAAKAGGKLEKIPMCTWDGKADKDTCKPSNFDVTHEYLFFLNNLPPYYDDFEVSWYETDSSKCFGAGSISSSSGVQRGRPCPQPQNQPKTQTGDPPSRE